MIFLNGNTELIWSAASLCVCYFELARAPGFLGGLWKEKVLIMMHALPVWTRAKSDDFTNGSDLSPSSQRAPSTPRRTVTPLGAALILPDHEGAAESPVHRTHWQETVLLPLQRCLISCGTYEYADSVCSAIQQFKLDSWFWGRGSPRPPPPPFLPLDKSFLSKLNL